MIFIDEDLFKEQHGIYFIKNIENGMSYVGQTKENYLRRFWHHQWSLRNNKHCNAYLQNAWNKYGEDAFEFIAVHPVTDDSEIDSLEISYIESVRQHGLSYNISDGGYCGGSHPMTERAKMLVGAKNREHMLGRKASEETKQKMRNSSKHTKPSKEHRKAISEYMKSRVVLDSTKEKLSKMWSGEKSPKAVINNSDAARIKQRLMEGALMRDIADEIGVRIGVVSAIASGRTFKNVDVAGWEDYLVFRKQKNTKKK